ncbi:MAG: hypothetical protein ACLRWQ_14100, partial [Flavonifractor plautii]
TQLNGSKVAISVTIPTFAKGGSGKVEAGDIIMLFATDKGHRRNHPAPELKYVEVLCCHPEFRRGQGISGAGGK